jgi:hypothetical protein
MFRRLAQLEAFDSNAQTNYTQQQGYQYNVFLPRMIPTGSSYPAPSELQTALQNVDPRTGSVIDVVPEVQRIFRPTGPAPSLLTRQQNCVAGSLDDLAGSQDPNQRVRCGWMYTPPTSGSPIPQLSQGYLGTSSGPLQAVGTQPPYQKWFWDLGQAQQQVRTDVCKSLKTCSNVGADPYSGCGYCTDIGQGVPVNAAGQVLYPRTTMTNCSPSSLVTSATSCPAPPSSGGGPGPGPQQPTCAPNASGQLSVPCLEQILTQAGCDQGALSLALSTGATSSDYMASARNLTSMTLYNKVATKPFNLSMYQQGQATVAAALQEAATVAASASSPPTSALGASARDLCLQAGAINQYDFCSELLPTTPMATVDPSCLQKAFLKAGGNENGTMYPSSSNQPALTYYSTLGTWGQFLQYLSSLNANAKGPSTNEGFASKRKGTAGYKREGFLNMDQQVQQAYQTQSLALAQLRGITVDALFTNRVAPPSPGIDLIGFAVNSGGFWYIVVQTVIPSLSAIPTYRVNGAVVFMTVTDLRAGVATPYILSSNAPISYLTQNQPTFRNTTALSATTGPTFPLSATDPNVLRMQIWGSPSLAFTESSSTPVTPTLIRESPRAPWIMLELDPATSRSVFQNILYADILQPLASSTGTVSNGTTDMVLKTPGKNGSIQLNGGAGTLLMSTLSYGVLNTFTVVFMTNGQSMGNALFVHTSPSNPAVNLTVFLGTDNQVTFSGTTSDGIVPGTYTGIFITPGTWYMMVVSMPPGSPSWSFSIQTLSYAQLSTTNLTNTVTNTFKFSTVTSPALIPAANQFTNATLGFGDIYPNRGVSPTFQLNIAWIHFFSQAPSGPELVRDALNNWQITQPEME